MGKVLRLLMIYICVPIYNIIPKAYDLFYSLANHRFFGEETIDQFSSNIYVLTCVVMLFAFAANLLAAIVNPDLMDDKKKGLGAMFKRALFGIMLIVLVPFAFDEAYTIQQNVMDNSLIEKIILGLSWDDGEEGTGGGNGGQVIAGTLMASVLYPVELQDGSTVQVSSEKAVTYYNKMISDNITAISKFAKYINEEPQSDDGSELIDINGDDVEYAFEFQSLVAVISGGACIYILVLYAIDMAVRSVKLGLLELIAPISIISYMAGGGDILKRWSQETGKTFLDVFIRIAIMAFYIYAVYIFGQDTSFEDLGWFAKVLMVVGLLIFVKQLPDLISKVFGTQTSGGGGGIGGRLGQMAGVGKIAQDGWNKIKNTPKNAAKKPVEKVKQNLKNKSEEIKERMKGNKNTKKDNRAYKRDLKKGAKGSVSGRKFTGGVRNPSSKSAINNAIDSSANISNGVYKGGKSTVKDDYKKLDSQSKKITSSRLRDATDNLKVANKDKAAIDKMSNNIEEIKQIFNGLKNNMSDDSKARLEQLNRYLASGKNQKGEKYTVDDYIKEASLLDSKSGFSIGSEYATQIAEARAKQEEIVDAGISSGYDVGEKVDLTTFNTLNNNVTQIQLDAQGIFDSAKGISGISESDVTTAERIIKDANILNGTLFK